MNRYEAALMLGQSYAPCWCTVCGRPTTAGPHHVVKRSQGGANGPVLRLCQSCHDDVHVRGTLHFRYDTGQMFPEGSDGWHYSRTDAATRYEDALELEGWRPLP